MSEDAIDRLKAEIADLRASRARLVDAADRDRRALERQLHDGAQQQLVAIAVKLQLAAGLRQASAARVLLDEISREVHDALDELRRFAAELYPPLLDANGLVVALRSAGADSGVATHVDAASLPAGRLELAATVYFCCLEALRNVARHAGTGAEARIAIAVQNASLVFEVSDDGCGFVPGAVQEHGLLRARDRVAAIGGRLDVHSEPGGGTRVAGSIPVAGD